MSVNSAAALVEQRTHDECPLMRVWRGAYCDARHITVIHQSQETLDRRTANRLCNHITQPCQARRAACPIQPSNVVFLWVIDDDPVMDNITESAVRSGDGGRLSDVIPD